MEVTIFGAGASGGTVGAFMRQAGHDVTVVDIAREHVDIISREGPLITGIHGLHCQRPGVRSPGRYSRA